jgi:peptide-methionine (S)-S-oxide reductase
MFDKTHLISSTDALPGRAEALRIDPLHYVLKTPLSGPYPQGCESLVVAMGCFWGVERLFWQQDGVFVTAAGYVGGFTPNPTYEEVCTGRTGHTEGVLIVHDPQKLSLDSLLKLFWERHDPTQGMRQGGDIGTQYRSALYYTTEAQKQAALASKIAYQAALTAQGRGTITTDILRLSEFYFAETYHQGYLAKNPEGYCGLKGTGVVCVI